MRVGLHLGYQNMHGIPDVESFMRETNFAVEAEAMGFDFVGPVEHHFTDYAACPDPFQMLAYVAAKTTKIDLITAAVIPSTTPVKQAISTAASRAGTALRRSSKRADAQPNAS